MGQRCIVGGEGVGQHPHAYAALAQGGEHLHHARARHEVRRDDQHLFLRTRDDVQHAVHHVVIAVTFVQRVFGCDLGGFVDQQGRRCPGQCQCAGLYFAGHGGGTGDGVAFHHSRRGGGGVCSIHRGRCHTGLGSCRRRSRWGGGWVGVKRLQVIATQDVAHRIGADVVPVGVKAVGQIGDHRARHQQVQVEEVAGVALAKIRVTQVAPARHGECVVGHQDLVVHTLLDTFEVK